MNCDALKDIVSAILAYSMDSESADKLCENTDFIAKIAMYVKTHCDGVYNITSIRRAIGAVFTESVMKGE